MIIVIKKMLMYKSSIVMKKLRKLFSYYQMFPIIEVKKNI